MTQTLWQQWTATIASHVSKALGEEISAQEVVVPPDTKLGDFAVACFAFAKKRGVNPAALAAEAVEKLNQAGVEGMTFVAGGPYVNVKLAVSKVVSEVASVVLKQSERFGGSASFENKKVMLEYAQLNTHKEMHVGHFRNILIGVSLDRIFSAVGLQVVSAVYHGDIGAHVAKCLWHLVQVAKKSIAEFTLQDAKIVLENIPSEKRTASYLGFIYSEASRALVDASDIQKQEVSDVQRKLENRDEAWEYLWQTTRAWCLQEMNDIFASLSVRLDRQYLESEVVDRGQEIVDQLIANGLAKESQGAIVVDLEDVKLGMFLIRKSDGTSLYATKDLALAELKIKEYADVGRSLILVDNRQMLYFKQLFETLRRMKISPVPEFVGYEFVTLKSGAMSSREGNIVTYQSFVKEVQDFAMKEIMERHPDWDEVKKNGAAQMLSAGGMKFGMLRQDSDKVFTFDLEQALSFEGATGPYCQYAVTRLNAILRKAKIGTMLDAVEEDVAVVNEAQKRLALVIAQLPEKVLLAAKELRPSMIAQWCLTMAQEVSAFYRDVPVLSASAAQREERLQLVEAAQIALSNGLYLLGIPTPDEM